jgi:hypothetical protein
LPALHRGRRERSNVEAGEERVKKKKSNEKICVSKGRQLVKRFSELCNKAQLEELHKVLCEPEGTKSKFI